MAGNNVGWERFEEQTKLAFVGDPQNSRFFLKTRVTAGKGVKVVARVSHHPAKPTPSSPRSAGGRNEAVKYTTADTGNLFRLMRLLRFVMQEVLGTMKTLPASTPLSPTSKSADAPAPASQTDKTKKSKKKKKAAKK